MNLIKHYLSLIESYNDKQNSGCGESDYIFLIDYLSKNRLKHIVEYGSGVTTFLISKLIQDLNLDTKFDSYEDLPNYYYHTRKKYNISKECLHLVDIEQVTKNTGRYVHSYDGFNDVDFVIIDGPRASWGITLNYEDICSTFSITPNLWIDGRIKCREYYIDKGYKEKILHH